MRYIHQILKRSEKNTLTICQAGVAPDSAQDAWVIQGSRRDRRQIVTQEVFGGGAGAYGLQLALQ